MKKLVSMILKLMFVNTLFIMFIFFAPVKASGEQANKWLLPDKFAQNPYYHKSYAIMVGIDKYPGWWPNLGFAVNDVYVMEARMKIHGFECISIFNEAATKENILYTLTKDLGPRLNYNDNVFFFFSGHTYTKKRKNEKRKDGFLVCYDTRVSTMKKTGISIKWLGNLMKGLACKHSYIFVDGCVSGTGMVHEKAYTPNTEAYMRKISSQRTVQMIVAGSNGQSLVEIGRVGLLVRNFVDALNGGADSNFDGYLTASELGTFLKPTVSYIASKFHVPKYGKYSGGGENIFKIISNISLNKEGMPEDIYKFSGYSLYNLPEVIHTSPDKSEMLFVPKGEFTFGSNDGYENEKPVYKVFLDEYYLDRYEVTNAQYELFNPNHKRNPLSPCNKCPVTNISWYDAVAYANWAGKRLPTETEWEKASRGILGRKYAYGNDYNPLLGWSNLPKTHKASPVGRLKPNLDGFYDMTGNVWEWCADWYNIQYYKKRIHKNPQGPLRGREKIIKGGSWVDKEFGSRSSLRKGINPEKKLFNIGLRLAMTP